MLMGLGPLTTLSAQHRVAFRARLDRFLAIGAGDRGLLKVLLQKIPRRTPEFPWTDAR